MSESKQLSDEARKDVLDELLLPLGPDAMPFALVGDEQNFHPEDWAWLFLSMNQEYRDAYYSEHAESNNGPNLASDLVEPDRGEIKPDHDGSCARRFGLAAWLNPSTKALPKLKNKEDSWFFPLKRPIAEDYRRKEVSDRKYVRVGPTYSPQLDKYPHLVANEASFGYRRPLSLPTGLQSANDTWGITWVAIDCSIPPDGQVSALRTLAFANRERLMDNGWKTNDEFRDVSVIDIAESDVFEHMHFKRSAGATNMVTDSTIVWRAVQIDSLGPIVRQIAFLLKTLGEAHQSLVDQGLAKPQPFRRFKNNLPPMKDQDREYLHGGSYLKALFVIAELAEWRHDANKIAQLTGIISGNDRYLNNWRQQFHGDIDAYITEAGRMIDSGYRFLIHAQKPNVSDQIESTKSAITDV